MQCSRDIVSFFPLLFTMCLLLSRYSCKYFLRSNAHTKSELISRFNSMNQHMGQIFEIYHNNGITTWQLTTSSGLLKTLCQPTSTKFYRIFSFFILTKLVSPRQVARQFFPSDVKSQKNFIQFFSVEGFITKFFIPIWINIYADYQDMLKFRSHKFFLKVQV